MSDLALDTAGDDQREVITQAAFARRIGISPQAVSKGIKAGRLPNDVREGKRIIWPDAEQAWKSSSDSRGGKADRGEVEPEERPAPDAAGENVVGLRDMKAETERLRQEQLRRQIAKDRDEFRPKAEVERAIATMARRVQQKMNGVVTWAPALAALAGIEVAEARAFLKRHMRELQTELAEEFMQLEDEEDSEDDAVDA